MATPSSVWVTGITLASLTGFFGVYLVLASLAVWSINRRARSTARPLKTITFLSCGTLLVHLISHSILFAKARWQSESGTTRAALLFVSGISTILTIVLADWLLVRRFLEISQEARQWIKWLLMASLGITAVLGLVAHSLHLANSFQDGSQKEQTYNASGHWMLTWGCLMLGINSLLSGGIALNLILTRDGGSDSGSIILRVLVESAALSWLGLCAWLVCSLALNGRITADLDVGYVFTGILPLFFGISQTLTVILLSMQKDRSDISAITRENPGVSVLQRSRPISQSIVHFKAAKQSLQAKMAAYSSGHSNDTISSTAVPTLDASQNERSTMVEANGGNRTLAETQTPPPIVIPTVVREYRRPARPHPFAVAEDPGDNVRVEEIFFAGRRA